ncbi:hypothetical protein [Alkalilacustris brevis]|uniref:hypothetical protein n=1 Tax=Alkalilacustris brevis TaxID=2026338 RepID=UPI000E0CEFD7|nr:hypothetical protein [Alkalilacustris brevis]
MHLIADGSIVHYDDDPDNTVPDNTVRGANVTLEAQSGSIGNNGESPLRVETEGGRLNARATGDIAITEMEGTDGDLRVELVESSGGSVTLIADYGSILDRNQVEERDIRTEAELLALYFDELDLKDENGERAQAQIDALRERRQREYLEYWQLRTGEEGLDATDTAPITKADVEAMAGEMFSGLTQSYIDIYGWSDSAAEEAAQQFIDAFVDERWGLYDQWNETAQFDDSFTYILTSEEYEPFLEGISWTEEQLTTSIAAGLVRQTGDTRTRVQAPNIIAHGDITLRARDSVGELLDDYEIHPIDPNAENLEYHLSAEDLMALAGADRLDLRNLINPTDEPDENDNGRITYSKDGIIRIVQREDFNVEFTGPNGALTVTTDEHEIFLGSDEDVRIRQVHGTNDVQILIDGAMTDVSGYDPTSGTAEAEDVAVIGTNLVLESGLNNSIGTVQTPLSVHILSGGSLNARAGTPGHQNVYITAFGDLPVEALFAGDTASLHATGAITDNVGSDLPRVVASNVYLTAAQIGSDDNLFGIELIDEDEGRVTLETFADDAYDGDVYLDVVSELNLLFGRIDQGGLINARKGITLFGDETLVFGDTAELEIRTALGIDTQFSTGTDITGHDLLLNSGGQVGSDEHRLMTAIDLFSYYGNHFAGNEEITALWLRNLRSIDIGEMIQNANLLSETDVETVGDMTLGLAQSLSRTRLQAEDNAGEGSAGDITRGTVIAEETELFADGGIGTDTRFEAVTGLFRAEAGSGDATLLLRDRAVDIDYISLQGGALDLLTRDAPVRLLEEGAEWSFAWTDEGAGLGSGRGIMTRGGDMRFHLVNSDPTTTRTSLSLGATIDTSASGTGFGAGGDIDILVEGSADQDDGQRIIAGQGTIAMEVEDDFTLASIWSENATDDALRLTVGGTLFNTGRLAHLDLLANASGALTTLRLGALDPAGNDDPDLADGLRTDLDRLDAVVQAGDMHLNDVGRLTLESVLVEAGNIDIFAGSDASHDMLVNLVEAPQDDATVVLSVLGDLRSGADTRITGDNLALFSFMGNITGEGAGTQLGSGGFFEATTSAGAELRMMAGQDLRYRERADDLRVLFMFAGTEDGATGHMEVEVQDGSLTVGLMGAAEDVRIEAQDAIDINLAGNTEFDIIDAGAPLNLVRSAYYDDVYQAHAPGIATLTALGAGSSIDVGLINLRDRLQLYAYEHIDARAYDVNPDNGLFLETSNPEGGFVGSEDIPLYIRVIGDGPRILLDDPYEDFQHLIDDRLEADGTLWLENSRIGWGEVIHAGPYFVGLDNNRIDGDVYFRQRTFDLYAHILYRFLDVDADAQIYAFQNEGRVGFTIEDEIILTTAEDVLVLNRKLAGVDLDGGQGFTYDVGSETETLGGTFIRGTAPGGVVRQIFQVMELFDEDEEELVEDSEEDGEEGEGAGDGTPQLISPELAAHLQASVN